MMHLSYRYDEANDAGETRHAQEVMKSLGITYQHSTPRSITDSFWFWNCQNVPAKLPEYLFELKIDPYRAIGHGLSKEDADRIAAGQKITS